MQAAIPPAIELHGVDVRFGDRVALEGIDLTVRAGDFVGIIGPNAGGKTTLLRVILGLETPVRGEVRVFGRPPAQARGTIGYVPQHARFDRDFPITVRETVAMGRLGARRRVAGPGPDRQPVEDILARVGLTGVADIPVGRLSGGQLQRTLIARALATGPRVLLLDEPTASLDTPIGRSVYELLNRLADEIPVVLVSHDIGVISQSVRSIACLNVRLHYHGSPALTQEMVEAAYGCPVDLVAHGVPHRVFRAHEGDA